MLDFRRPVTFSVIALAEDIRYGQRVDSFAVDRWNAGLWQPLATGTSIGARRYVRLERAATMTKVRLRITGASASPVLNKFTVYAEPDAPR